MSVDFTSVTETPETLVSTEALDMAWTRYAFAAERCSGKSVLEVACGSGPGLGHLAAHARALVGGDYTAANLVHARAHYGGRVPLVRLDALHLPFRPNTFDVVLLFEALYFLPGFETFVESCWRILSNHGVLVIVTANPEWSDFNPAPLSTRYFSAAELERALRAHRFGVTLYGGFPSAAEGPRARLVSIAKRTAVRLHMIPRTMKGKELLKRIAFGTLHPFPVEVSSATGTYRAPVKLSSARDAGGFKVVYAVARKDVN